ncbi:hypothetical protein QYF61_006756 [Mycteria americana]|uniref:Uncharacterized protein n=1 Tax=Mycteria americana TaxID=33587 RepID=A0AAN7S260_MYCAM|nr:hypothetical protein QYF61_006756 [Mycteria americana]
MKTEEPDSSQQHPLSGQEAMGTSKTHETPSEYRKTFFLLVKHWKRFPEWLWTPKTEQQY